MKRVEEKNSNLLRHDKNFLDQGFSSLAGVDEAGRGPLAGPVVASAVIVRDFSFSSRVNDSKKMTEKARRAAYEEILAKCVVSVAWAEADEIDKINIYQASLLAMKRAVLGLREKADFILIDGPIRLDLPANQRGIIDGDALSFSIACASVIAKVTRDRMMDYYDMLYPEYGFAGHRGYGTAEHMQALAQNGPCDIHRRSFEPVRKVHADITRY